MARYRYDGPAPVPDEDGEIVRPGDEREFDAEPGWGPWTELDAEDAALSATQSAPAAPPDAATRASAPQAASGGDAAGGEGN